MKSVVLILLVSFIGYFPHKKSPKLLFLDENTILVNGKKKLNPSVHHFDFKRSAGLFLVSPKMRFDASTNLRTVKQSFRFEIAKTGSDMDLYTGIFIQATNNKSGGIWMLLFDVKTSKLLQMDYSGSSQGLISYKQ